MAIAYFQPVTRGEISEMFGREISRDLIAALRAAGPDRRRAAQPAARRALRLCHDAGVFLSEFGFESLRDLPDIEKLEDAGLLRRPGPDGADPGRKRNIDSVELISGLTGVLGDELEEDAA